MKSPQSLYVGTCLMALVAWPGSAAASEPLPVQIAAAADDPPEEIDMPEGNTIIVRGQRLRGQLQVEQAPVLELNEDDIEGIGANSLTELLAVIAPQTGSSRGRGGGGPPAILVNGLRISSFRELRSYPPEAIRKVEVLPEEVAQKFGFPPDRRVVNLILKDNYNSREVEFEWEGPGEGGYAVREGEFTFLKFDQANRLNFNAEINDRTLLTEAERSVAQTPGSVSNVAGDPNPAGFRSLVSDRLQAEATLNWTKSSFETGSLLTLNGTYEREESRNLSGINSVVLVDGTGASQFRTFGADTPLERRSDIDTFSVGLTHSRRFGGWQFTATSNGTYTDTTTEIDQFFDTSALQAAALAGSLALDGALPTSAAAGFETAINQTLRSDNQVTFVGNPLQLPAGEVSTTFDLGFDWLQIDSSDTRTLVDTNLERTRFNAGGNVGIPIAQSGGAWGAVGDVTLNFTGGIEELSDFGTLIDASAGVTWSPVRGLTLTGTYILTQVAPSLIQLGSPEIETLNVPVFDFVTGESTLVTLTTGGNPDLQDEQQRDWKFGANWELPFWDSTRFSLEYIRNRSDDVTSGFPSLTQAIEDAFPDRVVRDGAGQLTALDQRFVTFEETRSERLVLGLTTRGSFGSAAPRTGRPGGAPGGRPPAVAGGAESAGAGQGGAEQGTGGRGGPPASGSGQQGGGQQASARQGGGPPPGVVARGFGRDGRGRYFLNLTHTVELENTILIASGVPLLDQLDGDATGTFGFPRHATQLEGGIFRQGKGLRVSGRYTGRTRIDGSDPTGASDLFFGDLITIDLRVFLNLGEIFDAKDTFANNLRLSFRADNVFNARRDVVDGTGAVPTAFQREVIDPTGRFLGIDLRKMF